MSKVFLFAVHYSGLLSQNFLNVVQNAMHNCFNSHMSAGLTVPLGSGWLCCSTQAYCFLQSISKSEKS